MRSSAILAAGLFLVPAVTEATWSIVAADLEAREVAIASATCVPQAAFREMGATGLPHVQAIVVPGVGVAAAQAAVDVTRESQRRIHGEIAKGAPPDEILDVLTADGASSERQFAIVDLRGRSAAFTGEETGTVALHMTDRVPGTRIVFSVQGNLLATDEVVYKAARAFREGDGGLAERMMRAMEAADAEGGDRRCTCAQEPKTAATAECVRKTAHVAYLLVAEPGDPAGESYNDGGYALILNVTDENIRAEEDASPVRTLRMRYDARKAGRAARAP